MCPTLTGLRRGGFADVKLQRQQEDFLRESRFELSLES